MDILHIEKESCQCPRCAEVGDILNDVKGEKKWIENAKTALVNSVSNDSSENEEVVLGKILINMFVCGLLFCNLKFMPAVIAGIMNGGTKTGGQFDDLALGIVNNMTPMFNMMSTIVLILFLVKSLILVKVFFDNKNNNKTANVSNEKTESFFKEVSYCQACDAIFDKNGNMEDATSNGIHKMLVKNQ